jgi:hypothetical protein
MDNSVPQDEDGFDQLSGIAADGNESDERQNNYPESSN